MRPVGVGPAVGIEDISLTRYGRADTMRDDDRDHDSSDEPDDPLHDPSDDWEDRQPPEDDQDWQEDEATV